MRSALFGIVPEEILERKRKAFVARGTRSAITTEWVSLAELSRHMSSVSLGIVDQASFLESLQKVRNSEEVPLVRLMRTIFAEVWLRHLAVHGIVIGTDRIGLRTDQVRSPIAVSGPKLEERGGELR